MSCLRIRSSSRSSGSSYTSPTVTENGKSFSGCGFGAAGICTTGASVLPASRSAGAIFRFSATFLFVIERHAHSLADFSHGRGGYLAGTRGARLQNIPGEAWIVFIFLAALLHGVEDADQGVCGPPLALDAAYAGRAAAFVHFQDGWPVAEDLVQVSHRANIGIARICAAHARRVGHHGLQLLPHHRLGIR